MKTWIFDERGEDQGKRSAAGEAPTGAERWVLLANTIVGPIVFPFFSNSHVRNFL